MFQAFVLIWQPRNYGMDEQMNLGEKQCYSFSAARGSKATSGAKWSVCHVAKPKQNISPQVFLQRLSVPHYLKWRFVRSKRLAFLHHLLLTTSSVFSVFQTDFEKDVDMACRSGEHITGENQQVTWFGD